MAEIIIFETDDALLYGVTPKSIVYDESTKSTKIYKKHWRLANVQWKGKLQVVKTIPAYEDDNVNNLDETCEIRLKELSDNELIGMAPYSSDGTGVQMV